MARLPDLIEFAKLHGLKIGTIADLIQYRSANETLVERVTERIAHTAHGPFKLIAYRDKHGGQPHIAMVRGEISPDREALVRVHEPVTVLDLIETDEGTHSWPVGKAIEAIAAHGCGVLVLLNCAQPAADVFEQMQTLARFDADSQAREQVAQRAGKVDLRTYGIGAQILKDLNVGRMRLLARPRKMPSMTGYDLEISGFEPGQ